MKRRYNYLLLGFGAVWIAAMLFLTPQFIALHQETKEALEDMSGYCNNVIDQQYAQAYSYSGSAFRAALSYNAFVQLYQSLQRSYGTLKAVKNQSYQVNGRGKPVVWKAIIDEDFMYDKKTIPFEFVLHKEQGHWVIFSAEEL